jgi:hypothetical protein
MEQDKDSEDKTDARPAATRPALSSLIQSNSQAEDSGHRSAEGSYNAIQIELILFSTTEIKSTDSVS